MRDKLETLPLAQLRELAKTQGLKGAGSLRKAELIDLLCKEAKKQEDAQQEETVKTEEKASEEKYAERRASRQSSHTRYDGGRGDGQHEGRSEVQMNPELQELDSGIEANGILEVMPDGFGFIRCENFLPGENDVYVAPSQIRRFNMKTGDIILGSRRVKSATEKFAALLFVKSINGYPAYVVEKRPNFEDLTPVFPNSRLHMETSGGKNTTAMRVLDLLSPIGKGQRGMIVSPPKAGKTTLLKQVAKAITTNHPDMHLIILLIDERPEEVTDIKEAITGPNVEVIYSTFDELPDRHKRVSEMVIERAKRLVEHGRDVMILLDSITRLARAYNLVVPPSGRTLSGGLDPTALHMPKRFFGAARNMREGGSLTILATALVDTGSRMDDVIYEEFKGTGNMELVLDRKLSEKRIFPAIDILKSGTRRDDLLLSREEMEAVDTVHKATNSMKQDEAVEKILDLFARTRNNREFVEMVKKVRLF
ncbi:MAG: transcription termination factor Rho [Lachnoclostridium edouardi]|uniref:transcription termination factor Rho n=1 Tax=Lachnoclostridium edouardi TaxID=1926283 RepID=UPI0026DAA9FC|nr:transcription termination factor Rho [Lachnoclostridium edouardi]MDO4277417.1 transcription termination factor Rho [Lachnoclostridium edouardi]